MITQIQRQINRKWKKMCAFEREDLKVAVVGLGKMGLLHSSIINVLPNVQLVAICDKSWLMRKLAKKLFKESFITDDVGELDVLGLDAVFITTPIPSHYNIIKEVYAKNITNNIFTEKTLSSTYAKSKELYELSQKNKGLTAVGYMKRFSVTFKKAKELSTQGILGKLLSFEAYAYSSDFAYAKQGTSVSGARGGVLEDLGSHVVDLALWFFGDLTVKSAQVESLFSTISIDSANFEVSGTNALKGTFDVSWCKEGYRMPEFRLVITGTDCMLSVDDTALMLELENSQQRTWYRQDLDDSVKFLVGDPEYFREDEAFFQSLAQKSGVESNFQTALKVDFLLEEVRRIVHE
jgi:predicted dehydrogenase